MHLVDVLSFRFLITHSDPHMHVAEIFIVDA